MRLLVSHQLLREECMQAGGLSHYLIIVDAMYVIYTETGNIKFLMLLVVFTLFEIHINKFNKGFVLV